MNRDGNSNDEANLIPSDLSDAIRNVYGPAGLETSGAVREAESSGYGACRFRLNGQAIAFRAAKTTPTKIGQFVTLWKRPAPGGVIAPLDVSDDVAFVAISVFDATRRGQFVFDRKTLAAKDIMSVGGKGGKRAPGLSTLDETHGEGCSQNAGLADQAFPAACRGWDC